MNRHIGIRQFRFMSFSRWSHILWAFSTLTSRGITRCKSMKRSLPERRLRNRVKTHQIRKMFPDTIFRISCSCLAVNNLSAAESSDNDGITSLQHKYDHYQRDNRIKDLPFGQTHGQQTDQYPSAE